MLTVVVGVGVCGEISKMRDGAVGGRYVFYPSWISVISEIG